MFLIILQFAGLTAFGMLIDIFFNRVPKLKDRCKAYNVPFSLKIYFKEDWLSFIQQGILMGAFLSVSAVIMRVFQVPIDYMYFLCLIGGAYGTNILSKRYSAFGEKLLKIVDEKTNISDSIVTLVEQEQAKEQGGDRPDKPTHP